MKPWAVEVQRQAFHADWVNSLNHTMHGRSPYESLKQALEVLAYEVVERPSGLLGPRLDYRIHNLDTDEVIPGEIFV